MQKQFTRNKKFKICDNFACPSKRSRDDEEIVNEEEEFDPIEEEEMEYSDAELPCTIPKKSPSPIRRSRYNPMTIHDFYNAENPTPCPEKNTKYNKAMRYFCMHTLGSFSKNPETGDQESKYRKNSRKITRKIPASTNLRSNWFPVEYSELY